MGGGGRLEKLEDASIFPDSNLTVWMEDICRQQQKQCI